MTILCSGTLARLVVLPICTALLLPIDMGSAEYLDIERSDGSKFATVVIPVDGDPDAIAVADVNGDGEPDLILANPQAGSVSVLLGDGKGHFRKAPGSPFAAGHLPNDVGVGDFNGDGRLDLLIANTQTPYLTLLIGDGVGGFRPAPNSPFTTNSRPHPHGLAVGHFCGNDKPIDAIIDSWGSGEIELLVGDGKGALQNGPKFPAGPGSDMPLPSADVNQDGIPDVVMPDTAIGHWNSRAVTVLLGDGRCGFKAAPGSPFFGGEVPWSAALGDVNSDGVPDIVVVPYGPQVRDSEKIAATVLLGDGKGGFHPMTGSPFPLPGCASPRSVAIGSLRGNGARDFAVTCMNSPKVLLFESQKGAGFQSNTLDVTSGWEDRVVGRGILMADLSKRGRDDVVISNGVAGTVTLLMPR